MDKYCTKIEKGKWYTAQRDLYCIVDGLCFIEKKAYYCEANGVIRNENGKPIELDEWTRYFYPSTEKEKPFGHKQICKICLSVNGVQNCKKEYYCKLYYA